MGTIEELRDRISALRVATTVDPQDKEAIRDCVALVEDAYPNATENEEWQKFTTQLETILSSGVRDSETTSQLYEQFNIAVEAVQTD